MGNLLAVELTTTTSSNRFDVVVDPSTPVRMSLYREAMRARERVQRLKGITDAGPNQRLLREMSASHERELQDTHDIIEQNELFSHDTFWLQSQPSRPGEASRFAELFAVEDAKLQTASGFFNDMKESVAGENSRANPHVMPETAADLELFLACVLRRPTRDVNGHKLYQLQDQPQECLQAYILLDKYACEKLLEEVKIYLQAAVGKSHGGISMHSEGFLLSTLVKIARSSGDADLITTASKAIVTLPNWDYAAIRAKLEAEGVHGYSLFEFLNVAAAAMEKEVKEARRMSGAQQVIRLIVRGPIRAGHLPENDHCDRYLAQQYSQSVDKMVGAALCARAGQASKKALDIVENVEYGGTEGHGGCFDCRSALYTFCRELRALKV